LSVRAHILLKNRRRKTLKVSATRETFSFRQGLYVLSSEDIREGPHGPELFYFENNPTPVNPESEDKSSDYFDEVILENFMSQVHGDTGGGLNLFGWLRPFLDNPEYMVGGILVLVLIWALVAGGFKI
jgi:hypothetical protein